MLTKRHLLAVGATIAPFVIWACSSNNNTPAGDAGTTTSSTSASTTGTGTSTSTTSASCVSDAAGLYDRLGQHAGIRAAVDAVVAAELADPDEKTYFFWQLTPTAGHPSANQVSECFTDLLANFAGGPEAYPPEGGVSDEGGTTWQCRTDQVALHAPLMISGGTFDKFVTIAAATLKGHISDCDLALVGGALNLFKSAVVTPSLADAGLQPFPGDAAPKAGDAGGQ